MARPRGFSQGRSRGPRRRTGWELGPGGTAALSVSTDSVSFLGSGIVTLFDGFTIARLRGFLSANLLTVSSAGDGYDFAVGVGLINSDAFAVGVTTILDPIGDADWDGWLYHRFFNIHAVTATIADGVNAAAAAIQFEVDSKAMRKLTDTDVIFAAVQAVENGAATAEVFFNSRLLMKLP